MLERDMEELIASYPEDFFPRQQLVLKERQQVFEGVGRFDLLFEDEHKTQVLMELKATPAKYPDADQLAKYKNELERRGEKNVIMWLVSPQIPNTVRDFLERIGIEFTEIHFAEFTRVAQRHGVRLPSEIEGDTLTVGQTAPLTPQARQTLTGLRRFQRSSGVETGPVVKEPSTLRWRVYGADLILTNLEGLNVEEFSGLIDAFEQAVPSRKNAHLVSDLRIWCANPRSPWPIGSCQSLLRWVTTSGWKDAVPHAAAIWEYMFGQPAPTWYVWDQSPRKYRFDSPGCQVWQESLPH